MKTSKKILSLFLALVMVITTCSVGFTAFAEDGSMEKAKAAYWNDKYGKDDTYQAVLDLVSTLIPQINLTNIDAVKKLLEGLGITVTDDTSVSDIVAGVSPILVKALNKGNEESIITGYYQEKGYSKEEATKMYKSFSALGMYDYLKDDGIVDFFTLYRFCEDYKDSSDSEKREFAQTNLPKLKALLQKHLDAFVSLKSENSGEDVTGTAKLKDYKNQVTLTFDDNLTLYDLENFVVGGTKLKDVHNSDHDCDIKIKYDNMYLDFEGAPFQIDNIASALFYQYNENYVMGIFYLYLATLGGATVKYNGTPITVENYKSVIGESKSYAEFCTDNGFDQDDRSASAYDSYCLNEVYKTIFDGSTAASKIEANNEFASPYYSNIALGALEATKSYDTSAYKNAAEFVDAQRITDDQIKHLYNYVVNEGGTFASYVEDDNCAFSSYVKRFYRDFLFGSDYVLTSIDVNLQNCADEDAAVEMFKKFSLSTEFDDFYTSDGDDIMLYYIDEVYPSDDATPFYNIANTMLPSAIIQQMQGKTDAAFGFPGTSNIKFFYEDNNFGKLVKANIGDAKFEYDNFKIDNKIAVDVVNTAINGYLTYLDPNSTEPIAKVVNDLLGKLLITDVDLADSLEDVWKNLYEDPIGTVMKLIPLAIVLVDEVLLPMVLNAESPEDSQLYSILVTGLGEGGGIEALQNLSQKNGNTSVGLGTLSFDLNKIIPAILNWLVGNEDAAKAIVGTYSEYAEGVDTNVPVFTNIYVADKAIYGAHLNGGLAKALKNGALKDNPEIADLIDSLVTTIAESALAAINEYLTDFDYTAELKDLPDKYKRYNANGDISQVGLNNIFVALPQILDLMGKNLINSTGVTSDWDISYKVQALEDKNGYTYNQSVVLNSIKPFASDNNSKPEDIFDRFVEIFIEEWCSPLLSLVNDLLGKPIVSDINLANTFKGLGKDLYKDPINTAVGAVIKLVPAVAIIIDELVVPTVFNNNSPENNPLYNVLINGLDGNSGVAALQNLTQKNGNTSIGIGNLAFDLNKTVPAILNWLVGNEDVATSIVGTYSEYAEGVDTKVPVFTNIYVADKALYGAHLNGGLAKVLKNGALKNSPEVADILDEVVTTIAKFALDAVNDYLKDFDYNAALKDLPEKYKRYNANGDVSQAGINNVFVAIPEILDIMGKNFIKSYGIKSDWNLAYKIEALKDKHGYTYNQNTVLNSFKALASKGNPKPEDIIDRILTIFVEEWFNPIVSLLNDLIQDDNSKFAKDFGIIQKLLKSVGGFGELSVISDMLRGFFQIYDEDSNLFKFEKQKNGFIGLNVDSLYFLIANIQFTEGGQEKGLIPVIKTLIEAKNDSGSSEESGSSSGSGSSTSPTIDNSSKIKRTPASELLTTENKKAAKSLIESLDKVLASLLKNTTLNDYSLDKTDNILYAVVTTASNYLGASNTNNIVKLIDNYLYCILDENVSGISESGKSGILPNGNDVDKDKVYTPQNLSVLVVQTYTLVEDIVDYLLYTKDNAVLQKKDPNKFVEDAIYGVISPASISERISAHNTKYNYSDTVKELAEHENWNTFKTGDFISIASAEDHSSKANVLKFNFRKGDKTAFYDGLGESLSSVVGIVGALLTSTNYYNTLVKPLFEVLGADNIMDADKFAASTESEKLIYGILTPVASALDKFYKAPLTTLLNLVRGVSAYLDDDSIKKIVNSVLNPIIKFGEKLNRLSPTLSILITSALSKIPSKLGTNIIVSALNSIKALQKYIVFPNIDWAKLAATKSPEEALLLIYGYLLDTVFGSTILTGLINSLAPGITDILTKLTPAELLRILNELLGVVKSPTEVYWTFSEYASKITKKFIYPTGVLASEASKAVDQLDDIVANVFPLLNELGVTDIEGIGALINDKLYTNELLTTIAKGVYGALSKGTAATVLGALSVDVSPKGFAKYLTDKKYGKTFSSAAKTLKKAKSWDKVKTINWGFKNGSSKAETGFINGLAAVLRPFNNVLAVLLAEGKLDASKLDLANTIATLSLEGSTQIAKNSEYGSTLTYKLSGGIFTLTVKSKVAEAKESVLKVDVTKIVEDLEAMISDPNFGTNGYESAVVPLMEAFMCKNIKTYKQYKADYKKAKDNLLIDVLTPVLGLVGDIADKPFDTVTKILPNVAYFIDSNGVSQAIGNLLAPVTAKDGLLGVLQKNGIDVDEIVKTIFGKSLGKMVTETLGLKKVKLNLDLNNLAAANVQDIVVPLAQSLLKSKLGLTLPDFDFETIASHGTIKTVKSKAMNSKGKYTTKQVQARQGEVLVAVLRYVSDVLIKNAKPIKKLITNIDAIKKNDTIKNIVSCVFNQMATARKDDIVRAVFYFLTERTTDSFFDYRNFKYKDDYTFSFGNMDEEFCRQLAPMLDGLVGGLLEGGLLGLIEEKLYTDNLVAKLATGLYGAIEGVNINDNIGSLTNLLAMTDIDFSTSNVASLLTNSKYGLTYPAAASVIRSAGSWSKVNADSLKFGVKDRESFLNALVSVLRPLYGVLDVLLNDASLNIFNLVKLPGSDGYTSTIVPLLEAFGVRNVKTQYQYREDCYEAYDNILLDIINPLWDKVEDILNAPVEMLADILPNLSLFFANDGLLQIVDNLFTPISALLEAIKPIVDVNEILKAAGLDVAKLLKDKVGLNLPKFDLYDLPGTLKPLVGANNVVGTLNSILGKIKIKGTPLGIVLPEIDWFKLASHGEFILNATSQAATYGGRIAVKADQDETLIAVLRFAIDTINYKGNYDAIVGLITGLLGDSVSDSISDVISQVLGMLKGDSDEVIEQLVDLLKQFA